MRTRSPSVGSMKAGRRKPESEPSMNREMCASLRPKGPVRKVPTSYDCSAESPGFNGGQHRYGGRAQLSRGHSSNHHDVAENVTGKVRTDLADKASRPPARPFDCGRRPRAANKAARPGLLPEGTAGSDSGKATTSSRAIRRGPFHHHHQPARLPNPPPPVHSPSSCRAATRGTYRDPGQPAPHMRVVRQGRALLQAVRRLTVKSAPDRKLFSARTCGGQRGSEKSICDRELDIEQHA